MVKFDFLPNVNGLEAPHGFIHSETVAKRLESIGAKEELIRWLREGVHFKLQDEKIDFTKFEASQNNKSVLDNLQDSREIVKTWEKEGYIERCSREQVDVINPLSLNFKYYPVKAKMKKRLCLDCSQISKELQYPSIKLPEPAFMAQHIKRGSYLFSADYEVG